MENQLFEVLGKIAGIGGLSIGLILVVFKAVLDAKRIDALSGIYTYRILRLIIVLSFAMSISGLGAWVYVSGLPKPAAAMQPDREIFFQKQRPGVQFDVLLLRGSQQEKVPVSHRFVNGDKLLLNLTLNRESSVYILNRTLQGSAEMVDKYAGTRGIQVLRDDDRKPSGAAGAYQLLFPRTGQSNRVPANQNFTVPSDGVFVMDEDPGIEKLYVILSPGPLNLAGYFDPDTGRMLSSGAAQDQIAALTQTLADWNRNGDTSIPAASTRGIQVQGYGVSKDASRPALVELDLRHSQR